MLRGEIPARPNARAAWCDWPPQVGSMRCAEAQMW